MKAMNFNTQKQSDGGAILENPITLRAIFGWLSEEEEDKPKVPKCGFTPL